jgi:energy-coupling factor transporter ATP-binding protein EcfA2/energy-coupling factor transporter transmembrane protein EcfT
MRRNAKQSLFGLLDIGNLPPRSRLIFVVLSTSTFSFLTSVRSALLVAAVALVIFLGAGCVRKVGFVGIVIATGLLYFLGNSLFSADSIRGIKFLIFRISTAGIIFGIVGALKRMAMLCVSLAWLNRTPIPEMYDSLAAIPPLRKPTMIFLRQMQLLRSEILSFRQSVAMRDTPHPCWDLRSRVLRAYLVLLGVLLRSFEVIGTTAFAAETHVAAETVAESTLEVEHLTVQYSSDGAEVLSDVCLHLRGPGLVYLGGVSGSGRTTLLRAISGYVPRILGMISTGVIRINGADISRMQLREIARYARLVSSDVASSIVGLTVGQEIMLCAHFLTDARYRLRQLGIDHLWDKETSLLSGGEQFRLALACALAAGCPLLLLDTPLAQLDPIGRSEFLAALDEVIKNSNCLVLIADERFDLLSERVAKCLWLERGMLKESSGESITTFGQFKPVFSLGGVQNQMLPTAPKPSGQLVARIENVSVRFGNATALSSATIQVHRGECVALVGMNGSGKTTAGLAIAGLVPVLSGIRHVEGRVAVAFQNPRLQTVERTVQLELGVAPKLQRWSDGERNEFVSNGLKRCTSLADDNPIDLHEQELRFLAVEAITARVSALVLDEPSNCLDSSGLEKLTIRIEELLQSGLGILLITHDEELLQIASSIVVLDQGRVTWSGTSSDYARR